MNRRVAQIVLAVALVLLAAVAVAAFAWPSGTRRADLGEVHLDEPDTLVPDVAAELLAVPVLAADLRGHQTSKVPPLRQYRPSSRVTKSFSTR